MDLNALDSGNRLASNYLPSDFAQPAVPGESMPHMFESLKLHKYGGRRRSRSRAASMEVRSNDQLQPDRAANSSPRNVLSPRRAAGVRATVHGLLSPRSPPPRKDADQLP